MNEDCRPKNDNCLACPPVHPDAADGAGWLVVNGTRRAYERMVWCRDPRGRIDYLEGSAFFGGRNESWATPRESYMRLQACVLSAD